MMTKRDFEAIAAVLSGPDMDPDTFGHPGHYGAANMRRYIAQRLADVCAASNPAFDRARFLKACGVAS